MQDHPFSDFVEMRLRGMRKFAAHVQGVHIFTRLEESGGRRYASFHFEVKLKPTAGELEGPQAQGLGDLQYEPALPEVSYQRLEIPRHQSASLRPLLEYLQWYRAGTRGMQAHLSDLLPPGTPVKVEDLGEIALFRHLEHYWHKLDFSAAGYEALYHTQLEADLAQSAPLQELRESSRAQHEARADQFFLTDRELARGGAGSLNRIRQFLLTQRIPIYFWGEGREIKIDATAFEKRLEAMAEEAPGPEADLPESLNREACREVLAARRRALYEARVETRRQEAEKDRFLKKLPVRPGDVILMTGSQVGKVIGIELSYDGEIELEYLEIKQNFEFGKRNRKCTSGRIMRVMEGTDFEEYRDRAGWKREEEMLYYLRKKGRSPVFAQVPEALRGV